MKRVSAFAQGYGGQGERKYTGADVSASFLVKRSFPLPQEPSTLVREQRLKKAVEKESGKILFYCIKHFISGIRLCQKLCIIGTLLPDGGIFNEVLQDFFAAVGR